MEKTNYKSTLHACYLGYITQALIVNLPPLLFIVFREKFGLSFTMLGSLVLIVFVTQPVSYTHLDVYKRQSLSSCRSIDSPP